MHTATARTIRVVLCTFVVLVAVAVPSQAESIQRVRTTSSLIDAVLARASENSPTLRSIVQRIAGSNVIVYVTCEHFKTTMLSGRTIWAEANGGTRYLRVQIDCMLASASLVAILGHELQHVAEVADRPDVIDSPTFVKLFEAIGYSTCISRAPEQFETDNAMAAGERVRAEYLHRWQVGSRLVTDAGRRVPVE